MRDLISGIIAIAATSLALYGAAAFLSAFAASGAGFCCWCG
jgi:hypothetical protein